MSGFFFRLSKILVLAVVALAATVVVDQPAPTAAPKNPPKAAIMDFEVEVDQNQVLVSFQLKHAFDENLKRRLESGLATSLTFDFELLRRRRMWFKKIVTHGQLEVSAKYNAVNREYLVNYKHDGDLVRSRLLRDTEELYAAMSEFEKLVALSVEGMKGKLVVRMRAELGTGSLLFFIPTRRTTDWVEKDIQLREE